MKDNNWISVKENKPPKFRYVLCYSEGGDIQIASIDASGRFDLYPFKEGDKITHWMPLPEPPTK